ncbi:Acid phosphatase/vanadium-dependent haloperoxidase-related [Parasponia andersonii]|uniref:Acid phosphatase/vanadium-dependent haloperoxidase-related n=1 Tax=Parasponia andersonii TaxID=3476 RepID=A0A2P5BQZ8_PARAD|nr:Acid phosphatase/vanadium-dependent haloperoxidase-related [Parasponia andersonii]
MWLHPWTISTPSASASFPSQTPTWAFPNHRKPHNVVLAKPSFFSKPRPSTPRAQLSDQIPQLVHNKVLIAAGVSAAIGQLSKPFTSVILYGKEFDIKAAIQAGGFPSTHSSAVVAAATCIGLERGFSDSIFGLTVVYAGLIMYDAQGVRREVGIHARTLNKVLKAKSRANSNRAEDIDGFDSQPGTSSPLNYLSNESSSPTSKTRNALLVPKLGNKTQIQNPSGLADDAEEGLERTPNYLPLKESIGHTEVEVIAGALFGFLVSLVVNTLI